MGCPICGHASLATSDYCADHRPTIYWWWESPFFDRMADMSCGRNYCTPAASEARPRERGGVAAAPYDPDGARQYWEWLREQEWVS